MSRLRSRCHRCGEEGAALVMVLAFLSLFGLAIAALLGFSQTSFKTTIVVRSQSEALYAADGAVEGAINAIRYDPAAGVSTTEAACKGFDPPELNKVDLTVTCSGSMIAGSAAGPAPRNVPEGAVFTTDGSTRAGIKQASNNDVSIAGNVFVRSESPVSAIDVSPGSSLVVNGDVAARGPCPGVSSSSGTVACSALTPAATAPVYPVDATVPTVYPALPKTCPSSPVIHVLPGYYDSASDLTFISRCVGKIVWFHPGVYYFDFQDTAVTHEWVMDSANTYLTGGTPGGDPVWNSTPTPSLPLAIPGSCDTTKAGVKFIFGGDSRIRVQDGRLEICATPTPSSSITQQIALYGLGTGFSATPTSATLKATGATSGVGQFANASNAIEKDTASADANLSDAVPSASLSMTGFNLAPSIPPGSILTSATMRVAHWDDKFIKSLTATITSSPGGSAVPVTVTPASNDQPGGPLHEESINLLTQAPQLAQQVKANGLQGFSVDYQATVHNNKTATERLGSIQIDVTYTRPAFRTWTGCTEGSAYLSNQNCAMLKVLGNPSQVSIHGTVYAPTAPIDLALTNQSTQVVDRGLVSSVLWLTKTASSTFTGTPISLPPIPPSGPTGRTVTVRAYEGTKLLLVAQVSVNDTIVPAHPVRVSHWSYQR